MRRHNISFEELISENIKEILNDPETLDKIEKRIDERSSKKNKPSKKYA